MFFIILNIKSSTLSLFLPIKLKLAKVQKLLDDLEKKLIKNDLELCW